MKKNNKFIFLVSLSAMLFSFGVPKTIAQNDSQQKDDIQKPSSLLVLNESQDYTLQNVSVLFAEVLDPAPQTSFVPIKIEQDQLGYTHQKLQQYYNGVKVEFGTLIVHSKRDAVESLSSEYYPIQEFDVTPGINNSQAFSKAVSHIGAQNYMWEFPDAAMEMDNYQKPIGELVILPDFNSGRDVADVQAYKLAYKFDMFATNPISRGNLYIDATNGQALFYDAIIKHATSFGYVGEAVIIVETEADYCSRIESEETMTLVSGTAATRYSGSRTIETRLSGSNYILEDIGRDVYTRDALNQAPGNTYPYVSNYSQFTDNDNNWTAAEHNNSSKDNAALDAHWGAMMTYDYWQSQHNRDSYNGSGAQIRSYVHVDNNYNNAFWNGSVMSYGDGSCVSESCNGFDALTSIDVAAHEIGHAVTTFTANLAYQRESGGLNEGFSDIWGAAVEHFAKGNGSDTNPAAAVWLIGDEIDRRSDSAALRSMSNPTSLGQPDTYGGTYWQNPNCGTPTNSNDYCGVHTNSGVLNYWYYLTAVGGSGTNDVGNAFNVSGVGMVKSSAIAYRTLNTYLSANSTFADARTAAIQSAKDLYGAGGAEEQAVTNAWYAVGVGAAYGAPSSYCASASTNTNDEYISRVQLGTIDNTSGAQFYSNFTSQSTDLNEGQSYTITVTPTWSGTVYAEGYAVWIDYNDDQDFDDAGELVWSKTASTNTPNSGLFTVPTGTAGAATRMRVSMKYNGVPAACETFTYGEVEDYTVNLGGATADTQAPSNPAGLAASNITQTTVDLSWNASSDNVGVTGYDVYQGASNLGTVVGTSAQITGLTASTAYTFSVRARDAAGNVSGASNTVNVTTSASPDTQAPSNPTSLAASNVAETTVDLSWNASTDNVGVTGYDVYQGAINLGTVTGTSTQITGLTASTAYSFSVRARDAAGNVSGASNTVNFTTSAPAGDTQAPSAPTSLAASNVTQTTVDLAWNSSTDNVGVTGYDVYQGATNLGTVTGTSTQITGLTASTAYSFSVRARDAAGNVSGASNSVSVTTSGAGGSTVLHQGFFESGWDGWVDGGSDSFRYAGSRSYEGTYSIQLRDNTSSSTMTLGSFNVTSYTSIDVEFFFYANSMENGEDFWVQFFNGSSWQTVAAYASGTSFNNNTFYTATVNIDSASYNFPSNAEFRFRCDASGNNDQIYIDQVTITGNSGTAFAPVANSITALGTGIQGLTGYDGDGFDFDDDFLLYPNPAQTVLNVKILDVSDKFTYRILNMLGQTVIKGDLSSTSIDVLDLQSGVYFIEINDGEELSTQRFIKN
jgi:Zn-dependent metalloprotease/chitodextrinase